MIDPLIYIDAAMTSVFPPETPFETSGPCTANRWFIYMTNRFLGRWSYLLAEQDLRQPFERYIQRGYTQLWLLKKVYTSILPEGASAPDEKGRMRTYTVPHPKHLAREDWPGRLYVIFREPVSEKYPHTDIIGYRIHRDTAIRRADQYASNYRRRAVVGLMAVDTAWH